MKSRIFVAVMLLVFAVSVNAGVVVVDYQTTGVDDEIFNGLTNMATGNGPAPAASGDKYQRFSLDAGDAIVQQFTTTEEITLDSLYIGYNDQQVTGTVRMALDLNGDTIGGPYDYDESDIALSGLQAGGDNNGPVHYLQFDLSSESIVIPAGQHRYIIWGLTEDGGDGFIIAPIRNFGDTYAGGVSNMPDGDDLIFAITAVPEPATMLLLGLGSLSLLRRKR